MNRERASQSIDRLIPQSRSPILRYGVALLVSGFAAGIDFAFPVFRVNGPLLPFYLTTSIAAWFGGFRAGLLAMAVSIPLAAWYFILPGGSSIIGLLRLLIFGLIMTAVCWLIDHRTRSRHSIEDRIRVAEAQEQRLMAMLSSAVRVAGIGSWEYDIRHDLLKWDDETVRIFGIPREAFGGKAGSFFAFVHPDDRPALKATRATDFAGDGIVEMEYRIVRPDGAIRYLYHRGQVTRYEAGQPVQISGVILDVTERRRAEESIRMQAHILDNVGQAVIATDMECRALYVNRFAGELYGWPQSEFSGRNMIDFLVPPGRHEQARDILHQLQRGDPWNGELLLQRRDGTIFPAQVMCRTFAGLDGAPAGIIGIATDITESKRAEEARQASEDRWRAIFDNSAVGIALTMSDGRFSATNLAYQRLVGYTEDELKALTFADITYEEDRAVNLELRAQLWEGRLQQFQHEKRYRRKDGRLIWVRNTVSIAPGTERMARFAMAVVEDITERRLLEEQLHQSQKMEAVGRLAGGIAHDFNNMLNVIMGHSEMMIERLSNGDPARKRLEKIQEAAARSAELTHQLLAFSRKQILVLRTMDLNTIIEEMRSMLVGIIGDHVDLVIRGSRKPAYVKADPGQMAQVLMNLIVNARDAMPGGGEVLIETGSLEIDKGNLSEYLPVPAGSYVTLSVSDAGCGIVPEVLPHVFEPFYTTKDQGQGTGLGLSIVYGIVRQSEGYIRVWSEPERGARFTVFLPRVESAPASTTDDPASVIGDGGQETILLAEDEPLVSEFTRCTLENAGYTVLEAHNSQEAIEIARTHRGQIDLLLTDVLMSGGTNGLDLAANLSSLLPELKVLYMTGYTADLIGRQETADIKSRILQKPFTGTVLRRRIREMLASA